MNKILIDSFGARMIGYNSGIQFANESNSDPDFTESEKDYYLNKIINSLLIHDSICIRIANIYSVVKLLGIQDFALLLESQSLEIIDDNGANFQVNLTIREDASSIISDPNMNGEIDALKFSLIPYKKTKSVIEQIEEDLSPNYYGKTDNKHLQKTLLLLKEKSLKIDGNALDNALMAEVDCDLNAPFIRNSLLAKNATVKNFSLFDYFIIRHVLNLNRTLAYQHELDINFFEATEFSKELVRFKFSPLFSDKYNDLSRESIFKKILEIKSIPDLAGLYKKKILSIAEIINIRNKKDATYFRKWYNEKGGNELDVMADLTASLPQSNKILSHLRFILPELIGFANNIVGIGVEIADNYFLDKFINKAWHPNFFLDNTLGNLIDKEIQKRQQGEKASEIKMRFGSIGRNDKCPCGSGRKFKKCHGKST